MNAHPSPTHDPELEKRLVADRLYAEWLKVRAELADPERADQSDEHSNALHDRENELARLIMMRPAEAGYQVLRKVEILEDAIGFDGGTAWSDNREVVMLGSIKADLLRFTPSDPAAIRCSTGRVEK